MKLVLFGGSFDPPHKGHLEMIKESSINSDKLILMPSFKSPLKIKYNASPEKHRINMLKLLINDLKDTIEIDSWEINRKQQSFTYLTIKYLKDKYPNASLSIIIGSDQLRQFNKWKNYKYIIENVHIICFQRDYHKLYSYENMSITWIDDFNVEISSSTVRKKIKNQDDVIFELTPTILKYIKENKLYGSDDVS